MKILVDLDSLLYVAIYKILSISQIKELFVKGYSKDKIKEIIILEADQRLGNICLDFLNKISESGYEYESSDVEYFLTSNIFSARKIISPTYKANRKSNKWVKAFKQHICDNGQATISLEWEADDLIANRAIELNYDCIICTIDKDLNQIQGWHFDLYKAKTGEIDDYGNEIKKYRGLYYISEEDANKLIWIQMLMGDASDNIRGIDGIGKVKANKILEGRNYFIATARKYKETFGAKWRLAFTTNHRLLKIGI